MALFSVGPNTDTNIGENNVQGVIGHNVKYFLYTIKVQAIITLLNSDDGCYRFGE